MSEFILKIISGLFFLVQIGFMLIAILIVENSQDFTDIGITVIIMQISLYIIFSKIIGGAENV